MFFYSVDHFLCEIQAVKEHVYEKVINKMIIKFKTNSIHTVHILNFNFFLPNKFSYPVCWSLSLTVGKRNWISDVKNCQKKERLSVLIILILTLLLTLKI